MSPTHIHPARDEHGNPTSSSAAATELYDRAIDRFLRFDPEVVDLAGRLAEEHPDDAMGAALLGYLHLSSTDEADVEVGRQSAATVLRHAGNDREARHGRALEAWARGDWVGAAAELDELLVHHPADLLALMLGHQLDFFTGDAANLRDRVARSLPAIDPQHPHHGFALGMLAFGLEESGHHGRSEQTGLEALETNADDVWAVHAVVHAHEMRGQVAEGIAFMTERTADWGSGNLFTVHNWWHLGLYHLEAGQHDRVLEIYDREIHHDGSDPVSIEMLDASAMLWRLRLDGVDVGSRFDALAKAWDSWDTGRPWYAFDDLHAVVARCGAGRLEDAAATIARLERSLQGPASAAGGSSNRMMTEQVGLPACRGILAHARGRHADAVAELAPIRRRTHLFGGSHAQRDLLQRTLTDSAIRSHQLDLAQALLFERLTLRPSSVYGQQRLAQVLRARGATSAAEAAQHEADRTARRFAGATP